MITWDPPLLSTIQTKQDVSYVVGWHDVKQIRIVGDHQQFVEVMFDNNSCITYGVEDLKPGWASDQPWKSNHKEIERPVFPNSGPR